MEQAQKYPDGDCRRNFGGRFPVRRSTSKGRGSGSIGSSVLRATAWKDLGESKVVKDVRPNARPGSLVAVDGSGASLFGALAMMVFARFNRGRAGRGR